jgi:hypothetical protein
MPETRTHISDIFFHLVLVKEKLQEAASASKTLCFFNQSNTTERSSTHNGLMEHLSQDFQYILKPSVL